MTTTIVTGAGGVSFDIAIRDHHLLVDQPAPQGGTDAGMMPIELLSAALGGCIAYYANRFLAARGLPTAGLRAEIHAHKSASVPRRIERFEVRIELPDGVPAEMLPLVERSIRSCPVHNTLTYAPAIEIRFGAFEAAA